MRTAALALLLLLPALPSFALFGLGERGAPLPVLWIPEESFSDWAGLGRQLQACPEFRFTVGMTPAMAAAARKDLEPLSLAGRLEAALRLPGDPFLGLILEHPAAPRPKDPARRLVLAREEFRSAWGVYPAGLVPGGGGLPLPLLPLVRSLGFHWAAVGESSEAPFSSVPAAKAKPEGGRDGSPTGSTAAPWSARGSVVLAALDPLQAPARELGPADFESDARGLVLDEASGLTVPGSFPRHLTLACDQKKPRRPWLTVSSAAALGSEPDSETGPIPPWRADPDPASAGPRQKQIWRRYAEAAAALDLYQNSGGADIESLEKAVLELYAAQAGRFQVGLNSGRRPEENSVLEKDFENILTAIYRHIGAPVPATLPSDSAPEKSTAEAAPASRSVLSRSGPGWIEFDNAAGPRGSTAAWRLSGLRVQWNDADLFLGFRLKKTDHPGPALEGLALQAYIDLNRQVGEGSTALVAARGASIAAPDAWEFAVAVTSGAGRLFRLDANGAPLAASQVQSSWEDEKAEVRIRLPRERLRGNSLRWVFASAIHYPADPAGRRMGALGPDAAQQEVASVKPGARLPAARAQ